MGRFISWQDLLLSTLRNLDGCFRGQAESSPSAALAIKVILSGHKTIGSISLLNPIRQHTFRRNLCWWQAVNEKPLKQLRAGCVHNHLNNAFALPTVSSRWVPRGFNFSLKLSLSHAWIDGFRRWKSDDRVFHHCGWFAGITPSNINGASGRSGIIGEKRISHTIHLPHTQTLFLILSNDHHYVETAFWLCW